MRKIKKEIKKYFETNENENTNTKYMGGTSLVVQWLRLHAPNAGSPGSIPGRGTKIPQAMWLGQKKRTKKLISFIIS